MISLAEAQKDTLTSSGLLGIPRATSQWSARQVIVSSCQFEKNGIPVFSYKTQKHGAAPGTLKPEQLTVHDRK